MRNISLQFTTISLFFTLVDLTKKNGKNRIPSGFDPKNGIAVFFQLLAGKWTPWCPTATTCRPSRPQLFLMCRRGISCMWWAGRRWLLTNWGKQPMGYHEVFSVRMNMTYELDTDDKILLVCMDVFEKEYNILQTYQSLLGRKPNGDPYILIPGNQLFPYHVLSGSFWGSNQLNPYFSIVPGSRHISIPPTVKAWHFFRLHKAFQCSPYGIDISSR